MGDFIWDVTLDLHALKDGGRISKTNNWQAFRAALLPFTVVAVLLFNHYYYINHFYVHIMKENRLLNSKSINKSFLTSYLCTSVNPRLSQLRYIEVNQKFCQEQTLNREGPLLFLLSAKKDCTEKNLIPGIINRPLSPSLQFAKIKASPTTELPFQNDLLLHFYVVV